MNGQYCVSSGNTSLDTILGGGLPLGTLTVLYEDSHSQFYSYLLKTYLAEGIVNKHKCIIVDSQEACRSRESWVKFLPNVSKLEGSKPKPEPVKEEQKADLQSAWRYSNLLEKDKNAGEIDAKPN